jgi:predicted nucleic acid-binding protein
LVILYLDTSALVKLFIDEAGRDHVLAGLAKATRAVTSVIACAECRSAFARRGRAGDIDDAQLRELIGQLDDTWPTMARVPVSESLARWAGHLAGVYVLRGFDAVHLATAARAGETFDEMEFLSFDNRLTVAAADAGLVLYGEAPASRG